MVTRQNTSSSQAVFHALSDPTRRRLLEELMGGPRPAGKLAGTFSSSRPAVARHLRVLRDAGLVRIRAHGRERVYALDARPLKSAARWIGRYEPHWKDRMDELSEYGAKPARPGRREP
jgi:DNA-binding transcriptional ArsR family regulator